MKELVELTPKTMGKLPDGVELEIFTVTGRGSRVLVESGSNATLAKVPRIASHRLWPSKAPVASSSLDSHSRPKFLQTRSGPSHD